MRKHRGECLGLSHVTFCPFSLHFFPRLCKHRGGGGCLGLSHVTKGVLAQGEKFEDRRHRDNTIIKNSAFRIRTFKKYRVQSLRIHRMRFDLRTRWSLGSAQAPGGRRVIRPVDILRAGVSLFLTLPSSLPPQVLPEPLQNNCSSEGRSFFLHPEGCVVIWVLPKLNVVHGFRNCLISVGGGGSAFFSSRGGLLR